MQDSLVPQGAPALPKAYELRPVLPVLERLAVFVEANVAYQSEGSEHLRAVMRFVEWAINNQYLPRQID